LNLTTHVWSEVCSTRELDSSVADAVCVWFAFSVRLGAVLSHGHDDAGCCGQTDCETNLNVVVAQL
jgi:hypothetical protein